MRGERKIWVLLFYLKTYDYSES